MTIKFKQVVKYGGHSITANGAVNFTMKADYDQLTNSIRLMQLLNNDVLIKAKLPGQSVMKLGSFRIKQIVIDGDGESTLKFNGLNDYIEVDNLNILPTNNEETKQFAVMYEADVESEEADANADEED